MKTCWNRPKVHWQRCMDELLKNHYQLICREDPWRNRYLKNPPIRTKKQGTVAVEKHVQWRHCFAIYTDLQRPNDRVSLRTVKSQLERWRNTVAVEELNIQELEKELLKIDLENGSTKYRCWPLLMKQEKLKRTLTDEAGESGRDDEWSHIYISWVRKPDMFRWRFVIKNIILILRYWCWDPQTDNSTPGRAKDPRILDLYINWLNLKFTMDKTRDKPQ